MGITPLHIASLYGRSKFIKFLKGLGADLDVQDSYGVTPLHMACKTGEVREKIR